MRAADPSLPASSTLEFWVNGVRCTVPDANPRDTLLEYLRETMLSGAKLACGTGGCGACTVIVTRLEAGVQRNRTVNACITPLCFIDGAHVTTVEGVGSGVAPHAVQTQIAELHGSQCGFCTPGFVMSLYAALANKPAATASELEAAVAGNLCRCTGYRPLLDAAKSLCCRGDSKGAAITTAVDASDIEAWRSAVTTAAAGMPHATTTGDKLADPRWCGAVDARIVLPPDAARTMAAPARELHVLGKPRHYEEHTEWLRPASLRGLVECVAAHPDAVLVGGETDFDYRTHSVRATFIDRSAVPELNDVRVALEGDDVLRIGGAVSVAVAVEALDVALAADALAAAPSTPARALAAASRRQRCVALRNAFIRLGTPQVISRRFSAPISRRFSAHTAPFQPALRLAEQKQYGCLLPSHSR
mgnify:FL=1